MEVLPYFTSPSSPQKTLFQKWLTINQLATTAEILTEKPGSFSLKNTYGFL
jgi:hypothetical protein